MKKKLMGILSCLILIFSTFSLTAMAAGETYDGIYFLANANSDLTVGVTAVHTASQVMQMETINPFKWIVEGTEDGYYVIRIADNPLLCLSTVDGNIILSEYTTPTDTKKWDIQSSTRGTFSIFSVESPDQVLYVENASTNNGARLILENYTTAAAARWYMDTEDSSGNPAEIRPVQDGRYILTNLETDKSIFAQWQNVPGLEPYLGTDRDAIDEYWYITYNGNSYYTITSFLTPKFALTYNGSQNITQELNQKADNQLWMIREMEDGSYNFIPKNDLSKYLIPSSDSYLSSEYISNEDIGKWSLENKALNTDPFSNDSSVKLFENRSGYGLLHLNLGSASPYTVDIKADNSVGASSYGVGWFFEKTTDGFYRIHAADYPSDYLGYDFSSGELRLMSHTEHNGDEVDWKIIQTSESEYMIVPKWDQTKALYVSGEGAVASVADICYDNLNGCNWIIRNING